MLPKNGASSICEAIILQAKSLFFWQKKFKHKATKKLQGHKERLE
jgi:hypothetical protein